MYSIDFTQYNNLTQSDYNAAVTAPTREFRNRVSFGYWSGTPRTFTVTQHENEDPLSFTAGIISLSVNQVVNSDSKLTMGSACSSALKLDFYKPDTVENLSNKVVRIESGLKVGDQIVYVPIGYFNIAEFTSDDDYRTIHITGYDDMERLSDKWTPGQTTPTTAKDVVDGIASKYSVSVEYSTAAGTALSGKSLSAAQLALLTSYTEREVLGLMAGLGGANAFFDARGVLCVKWFTASGVTVPLTLQWQGGLKKTQNEAFTIASVTSGVDDQVYTAGTGKGITFVNPLITQAEVQTIYNDVSGAQFQPCEVLWRGNPLVGCGDAVTVYDKHNNACTVYVAGQEIDLTGGFSQKIICPTADGEINFQTADERTALAINLAKTALQQAMIENTEIIRGANGGYVALLDRDGDDGNDALIISSTPITDPEDPENPNADYIIATHTGIGLHDGSSGQLFGTAITGKGINADAITAGQMSADRLSIGTPAKIHNLIPNGTFYSHGGSLPHQTARSWSYDSSKLNSLRTDLGGCLCHFNSDKNSADFFLTYTDFIKIQPSQDYTFSYSSVCSSGYYSIPTRMYVRVYDSDKELIHSYYNTHNNGEGVSDTYYYPTSESHTESRWFTAPSNAAYFKVEIWMYHTQNDDAHEIGIQSVVVNEGRSAQPADDLLHPASGNVSVTGQGINVYQGAISIYDYLGNKNFYTDDSGRLRAKSLDLVDGDFTLLSNGGRTKVYFSGDNLWVYGSNAELYLYDKSTGRSTIVSPSNLSLTGVGDDTAWFTCSCNNKRVSIHGNLYVDSINGENIRGKTIANESDATSKTNITPAASMLAKILSADIYNYDYVSEVEEPAETEEPELILNGEGETIDAEPATPQHYGLVIGEGYNTPEEVISKDGKGVDLYSMISIAWKAIQEQQAQIAALEQRIAALEGNE